MTGLFVIDILYLLTEYIQHKLYHYISKARLKGEMIDWSE